MSPRRKPSALGAADILALLAAPTFAALALLTAIGGEGTFAAMCSGSTLGGMAPMYLLMSVFHGGPWVRTLAGLSHGLRPDTAIVETQRQYSARERSNIWRSDD